MSVLNTHPKTWHPVLSLSVLSLWVSSFPVSDRTSNKPERRAGREGGGRREEEKGSAVWTKNAKWAEHRAEKQEQCDNTLLSTPAHLCDTTPSAGHTRDGWESESRKCNETQKRFIIQKLFLTSTLVFSWFHRFFEWVYYLLLLLTTHNKAAGDTDRDSGVLRGRRPRWRCGLWTSSSSCCSATVSPREVIWIFDLMLITHSQS